MKKRQKFLVSSLICLALCLFSVGIAGCDSSNSAPEGHTHVYDREVANETYLKTEATCTDKAVYYKSCECGEKTTETFEYGELSAHDYSVENVDEKYLKTAATCTGAAVYYKSCSACGESGTETFVYGTADEHDFTVESTSDEFLKTAGTCVAPAVYYKSCFVCGERGTETFESSYVFGEHDYSEENTAERYLAFPATCTQPALYHKSCSVCGESGTETFSYGEADEHSFTAENTWRGYLKTEASCTEAAVYYKSCATCGAVGTETFTYGDVAEHKFVNNVCTGCNCDAYKFTGSYGQISGFEYCYVDTVEIPSVHNGMTVTSIASSAFENCDNLVSITIPKSVSSIGKNAFKNCGKLQTVNISDIKAWCSIEFWNLYSKPLSYDLYLNGTIVSELVIPDMLEIGAYTFSGCRSLTDVTISGIVKEIHTAAFYNCTGLTDVTVPDNVTSIGAAVFNGCSGLESITLPFVGLKAGAVSTDNYHYPFGIIFGEDSYTGGVATEQYWDMDNKTSTKKTYYIPKKLTTVTVTGGNILDGAFYNCTNLTNITLPKDLTNVGFYAFYNCQKLSGIIIPDNVTVVSAYAFYNCKALTSVTMSAKITNIGNNVFERCTLLKSLTFKGSKSKWSAIKKGNSWKESSGLKTVNCTDGDVTL